MNIAAVFGQQGRNYAVSDAASNSNVTSGNQLDSMEVTLTCGPNSLVMIKMINHVLTGTTVNYNRDSKFGDVSAGSVQVRIRLEEDSTEVDVVGIVLSAANDGGGTQSLFVPNSGVEFWRTPSAGSHTWKLNAATDLGFSHARLLAIEF